MEGATWSISVTDNIRGIKKTNSDLSINKLQPARGEIADARKILHFVSQKVGSICWSSLDSRLIQLLKLPLFMMPHQFRIRSFSNIKHGQICLEKKLFCLCSPCNEDAR